MIEKFKPLTRKVIESDSKEQPVFKFELQKFQADVPEAAVELLERARKSKNEFKVAETTRLQTGLNKIEEMSIEEEVEKKLLEKLKAVQESAYQEAYQLGLTEGRKEAFTAASSEIQERLSHLDELLTSFASLKTLLLQNGETHLIKLLLHMASRVALHEVQVNNEALVAILKSAVESAQTEETYVVHVSHQHLKFFEDLQKSNDYKLEFLKRAKFIPDESMTEGGCVVETNHGEVDARSEERINKLWASFQEQLYPIKEKLKAVS